MKMKMEIATNATNSTVKNAIHRDNALSVKVTILLPLTVNWLKKENFQKLQKQKMVLKQCLKSATKGVLPVVLVEIIVTNVLLGYLDLLRPLLASAQMVIMITMDHQLTAKNVRYFAKNGNFFNYFYIYLFRILFYIQY